MDEVELAAIERDLDDLERVFARRSHAVLFRPGGAFRRLAGYVRDLIRTVRDLRAEVADLRREGSRRRVSGE